MSYLTWDNNIHKYIEVDAIDWIFEESFVQHSLNVLPSLDEMDDIIHKVKLR